MFADFLRALQRFRADWALVDTLTVDVLAHGLQYTGQDGFWDWWWLVLLAPAFLLLGQAACGDLTREAGGVHVGH